MINLHAPKIHEIDLILHLAAFELKDGNLQNAIEELKKALHILENLKD